MKGEAGKYFAVLVAGLIGGFGLSLFPWLPPVCEADTVYYDQVFVDKYSEWYDQNQSTNSCTCPGTREWVPEAVGWICTDNSPSLPTCHTYPYLHPGTCECPWPRVWYENEGEPTTWSCTL